MTKIPIFWNGSYLPRYLLICFGHYELRSASIASFGAMGTKNVTCFETAAAGACLPQMKPHLAHLDICDAMLCSIA